MLSLYFVYSYTNYHEGFAAFAFAVVSLSIIITAILMFVELLSDIHLEVSEYPFDVKSRLSAIITCSRNVDMFNDFLESRIYGPLLEDIKACSIFKDGVYKNINIMDIYFCKKEQSKLMVKFSVEHYLEFQTEHLEYNAVFVSSENKLHPKYGIKPLDDSSYYRSCGYVLTQLSAVDKNSW